MSALKGQSGRGLAGWRRLQMTQSRHWAGYLRPDRGVLSFRSKASEVLVVKRRDFIKLLVGACGVATRGARAAAKPLSPGFGQIDPVEN